MTMSEMTEITVGGTTYRTTVPPKHLDREAMVRRDPKRVAAVIPIANGLPLTETLVLPNGYCDIENVSVWQFHGELDGVLDAQTTIDNHELIINNCTPLVTPRITIFLGEDHDVHHGTWNLTMMEGGNLGVSGDPMYDLYDQSLFDWLSNQTLQNRPQ